MKSINRLSLRIIACVSVLILIGGCSSLFTPKQSATFVDQTTGMEFVLIPAGCYQMGNLWGNGRPDETPAHRACVDSFYLGKTEVTQEQWNKIMTDNPSYFKKGGTHPVESVSWNDAHTFMKKMSANSEKTFRLPTETEWEYACRSGGKEEVFCGGDSVDELAWFDRTGGGSTQEVATRQPNGLGIYDMSGNVWEFCSDIYAKDYYSHSPEKNPQGVDQFREILFYQRNTAR